MAEIHTWTAEMDAAALKAKADGATTREIALMVGVSHGALRYRISCLRQQGMEAPGSIQIQWSPEADKTIIDGRKVGKSYAEIGLELGISRTSIRTHYYRLTGNLSGSAIRKAVAAINIEPKVCYCCRKKFKPTQKGLRKCDYCKRNGHDQSCYDLRILTGGMPEKRKERVAA